MDKYRSIEFEFIGLGYGGSRIAAAFMKEHGYKAYAINTAQVDLGKILLPKGHKLLLENQSGGAGKDMNVGQECFEQNIGIIRDFIWHHNIHKAKYVIVCIGGGGGTGTGGAMTMIRTLLEENVPVGIIITLPLQSEDIETKKNCLIAIKRLHDVKDIKPIIIIDNAKISKKYPKVSIADFWDRANKDFCRTFHMMNKASSQKGYIYSLDPADYRKIFITSGCLVMGETSLKEFKSRSKLIESLHNSIAEGLYASDFDLSRAHAAGIILRAAPSLFQKIPEQDITHAFEHIKDVTHARRIYWGIYADHAYKNRIRVQSVFSGLDLPVNRIQEFINDTKTEIELFEEKNTIKKAELDFDYFFNDTNNE